MWAVVAFGLLASAIALYFYWLSSATPKILMLHRIHPQLPKDGMNITPHDFLRLVNYLKRWNYRFYTLSELIDLPKELQRKAVALTLDDGYVDNYTQLFPLLRAERLKATVYLVTQPQAGDNMLTPPQIKEMAESRRVEFGAHSCTHVNLLKTDLADARYQIEQSKKEVESLTGKPCSTFAYPYGRFNPQLEALVQQAGYASAVSTRKKIEPFLLHNRYALPRISINGRMALWQFRLALLLGRYKL